MSTHEQIRRDLGSYVAGALDPVDRGRLEEHLATCAACREELASYAGLPGLMSRLSLDEVLDHALLPAPSLLPRLLDTVQHERRADRSRLRRWRLAAGGLAATAAASVLLAVVPGPVDDDQPTQQLVATAGSPAAGTVALEARPWGDLRRAHPAGTATRRVLRRVGAGPGRRTYHHRVLGPHRQRQRRRHRRHCPAAGGGAGLDRGDPGRTGAAHPDVLTPPAHRSVTRHEPRVAGVPSNQRSAAGTPAACR